MGVCNVKGKFIGDVYYNCLDYGVTPESTDNTAAMQALIDLIYEKGGGVIWIPKGKYVFDSVASKRDLTGNVSLLCEMKSRVSIIGESIDASILAVNGTTASGAALFAQNSEAAGEILTGCTFQNFSVDMQEMSIESYGHKAKAFYFSGIKDCVFRDLRLLGTPSTSLGIDMLDNVVMDSLYVYKGGRQWVSGGNGGAGIGIGTGKWKDENYIIRNCVCVECGHYGIFLEDQGIFNSNKVQNFPAGQIIANNVIRNGRNYGIGVRGGMNVLVTGNNVYECAGGIYTDYGAKDIAFAGNLVQGCTGAAFCYGDESKTVNNAAYVCSEIAVLNNVFIRNGIGIQKLLVPTNSVEQANVLIGNTADEA